MQVYGADKVWKQMQREGVAVARCTVERLMKRLGLRGAMRGKVVRTTIPDAKAPCPLDRVNRVFKAERPNQLWVSDFTYVSTWQGWLYVAFVKAELIHRRAPWKTRESVELATLEWVAWFNNHRLMEPLGYIPPAEAEANYSRQQASQTTKVAA
jgi:transposase InsO family protein